MRRARQTWDAAIHGDHREVMGLVSFMVQGLLEKYHTLIRIDVEEIRAVLRVVLNGITDLLIYTCENMSALLVFFLNFIYINLEEIIR